MKEKDLTHVKDFSSDFMNQIADDLYEVYRSVGVTTIQKDILKKAAKVIHTLIIQHEIC